MKISCCTSVCQCQIAAEAGFDRVVLSASELAHTPEYVVQSLAENLSRWGLECRSMNDFCPSELKLCGPEYHLKQVVEYIRRLAPRAASLGVTQIGIGAPGSRMLPVGYSRARAEGQLQECMLHMAEQCAPYGIRILLEPICRQMTNFLNHTTEVFRLVEHSENVGMVYDVYHAWMMRESPAAILQVGDKIEMVHIAHAEHGRRLLTRDNIQRYASYAGSLMAAGYDGEVAVECSLDDVEWPRLVECCRAMGEMFLKTNRRTCLEGKLQDLRESG